MDSPKWCWRSGSAHKKLSWCWQTRVTPCYIYIYNQVGWCAAKLLHIFYFQNGGRPPSSIFIFSQFSWKIQICAYIFIIMQYLMKIRWCVAELLHIFDLQNDGRSPSCIFMFAPFLWKIQVCANIFIVMQNLVNIGLSTRVFLIFIVLNLLALSLSQQFPLVKKCHVQNLNKIL